jgi:hypothetical protein
MSEQHEQTPGQLDQLGKTLMVDYRAEIAADVS